MYICLLAHSKLTLFTWSQDKRHVTLPRQRDKQSRASTATLDILRVLEFDSQRLKSGVIVSSDDAPSGSALLFIKGAPGVVKDMVLASSVPSNYTQVVHRWCTGRKLQRSLPVSLHSMC